MDRQTHVQQGDTRLPLLRTAIFESGRPDDSQSIPYPESHEDTLGGFSLAPAVLLSSASRCLDSISRQTKRPLHQPPDMSEPLPEVKGVKDAQIPGVLTPSTSPNSKQKGTITKKTAALWRKSQTMVEGNQWLLSRKALKAVKKKNGKYAS